jgi:hypothetical protein
MPEIIERGPGGWPVDPGRAFTECHDKLKKARKQADHWRSNFNYLKEDLLRRPPDDLARTNFELENKVRNLEHDLMHSEESEQAWEEANDAVVARLHKVAEAHHPGEPTCDRCRPIMAVASTPPDDFPTEGV